MIKPIKPEDVQGEQNKLIPEEVIEVFNQLIIKNWEEDSAIIKQEDIINILAKKGYDKGKIFDNNYLDIEDIYRESGWKVEYRKPMFHARENFETYFKFSKKGT